MKKKVVIFLADGYEEVEAITPIDYLRRAGIEVCTVSLNADKKVTGSHNIPIIADKSIAELAEVGEWDAVLVPGGPGVSQLAASNEVGNFLKKTASDGKLVAAICAAPAAVLFPLGLLQNRRFTCFPGLEDAVTGAVWSKEKIVTDGNIITSRAAGTAALWSIAVIGYLEGEALAEEVGKKVLVIEEG
jgi:4-methyl-5(b-hydroxyethyl)-thiazole monophosphate biosynthesis